MSANAPTDTLANAYRELQEEATLLAGGLRDLAQRASVYRHIYRSSQGNHVFPLIAAHGALWAGGQFRLAVRLGQLLAWQYAGKRALRNAQLARLEAFCDTLRDINRRVCVDTYVQFHFSRRFRGHAELTRFIPAEFLAPLNAVHQACERRHARRRRTTDGVRSPLSARTGHIVGETLDRATAEFRWPLARFLALRPRVRFAYLPARCCLAFRDFSDRHERIRNGLRAFDLAASVGWNEVEASLEHYGVLDSAALAQPDRHFGELLATLVPGSPRRAAMALTA